MHKTLAYVVVSTTPYHAARLKAFADRSSTCARLVEITNRDDFTPLQWDDAVKGYEAHTLFPNVSLNQVSKRQVKRALFRHLDATSPDAVCFGGWGTVGSIPALEWCVKNHRAAVVLSESTERDSIRHRWREAIKARIVGMAASALVGGTLHLEYLASLGVDRSVISMGYDAIANDYFSSGSDLARRNSRELRDARLLPEKYFLACSRFAEKKNLNRLLSAYRLYRGAVQHPWEMVIVGDGELRASLLKLKSEYGLSGLKLVGAVSYDELPIYYGLAEAFVHVSTTEQWGLVVNEAMASGLPVVVSDRCGCVPDLVTVDGNGFLCDPFSVESIAKAMAKMSRAAPDLEAMGEESRKIIARWGTERFADGLEAATDIALRAGNCRTTIIDRILLHSLSL
jgi:1,2-diacylglycerol 3-alpha-glucosyltransferase